MLSVDTDGSGTIDYNEFLSATIEKEKLITKSNLELAFKKFDRDGSGKISKEEIEKIFYQSGVKDSKTFENMIREGDKNNDNEISMEEFKALMFKFFD